MKNQELGIGAVVGMRIKVADAFLLVQYSPDPSPSQSIGAELDDFLKDHQSKVVIKKRYG